MDCANYGSYGPYIGQHYVKRNYGSYDAYMSTWEKFVENPNIQNVVEIPNRKNGPKSFSTHPTIQKPHLSFSFFFYAPKNRRDHKSTGVTTGSTSWVRKPQLILLSSCTSIYFRKFDTIIFSWEYIYLFLIFKLKKKSIGPFDTDHEML